MSAKIHDQSTYVGPARGAQALGAIGEESEEDEGSAGDQRPPAQLRSPRLGDVDVESVPQAFSHYTYDVSGGKQLVCDLQGVRGAPLTVKTRRAPLLWPGSGVRQGGLTAAPRGFTSASTAGVECN